jgi:hypothetical protein
MKTKKRAVYKRLNAAQCLQCGRIIVSYTRHDYVSCDCKNVAVDGGFDYYKRNFVDRKLYREIDIYEKI